MASQSDYNFNNTFSVNNLRIKQAIIDSMLPNAVQNLNTNILRNQQFYESLAKQLAANYLPYGGSLESVGPIRQQQMDDKGVQINLNITDNPTINDNGYFNNVTIIPNLQLVSNYTQRNFFDSSQNTTETITIDIPLCTMNISWSNRFAQSSPLGYNGTIDEDLGANPYQIQIEGVFIAQYIGEDVNNPDQNRPDVSDFVKMCVRNKEMTINNSWIENKTLIDLSSCLIKSFNLPNDNTMKNLQRFSLTAEGHNLINIQ